MTCSVCAHKKTTYAKDQIWATVYILTEACHEGLSCDSHLTQAVHCCIGNNVNVAHSHCTCGVCETYFELTTTAREFCS